MILQAEEQAQEELKKYREKAQSLTNQEIEKIKKEADKERGKLNARFGQESKQKAIQYIFDEAKKLWEKID